MTSLLVPPARKVGFRMKWGVGWLLDKGRPDFPILDANREVAGEVTHSLLHVKLGT